MKISVAIDDFTKLDSIVVLLEQMADVIQIKSLKRPEFLTDFKSWMAKRSFWIATLCLFLTLFGTNLPVPLYALYRTNWSLSPGKITLLYAVYAFAVIPTIVLSGQLARRWGLRNLFLTGACCSLLGSICFGLADGPDLIIVARLFQGLAVGLLNGVSVTFLTRLDYNHKKVGGAVAAAMAVTLGNALGPMFSGTLGMAFPADSLNAPFAIHAVLTLFCMLGLLYIHEERGDLNTNFRLLRPRIPVQVRKPFRLSAASSFVAWTIMSLYMSIIPAFMDRFIGTSSLLASGCILAFVLLLSSATQWFMRRQSPAVMSIVGIGLLMVGFAGLGWMLVFPSAALFIVATMFIGSGHGPVYAGSLAYLNEHTFENTRTDVIANFYVYIYLGVSVPVLGLAYGSGWIGLSEAALWLVGCMEAILAFILPYWWIVKNRR